MQRETITSTVGYFIIVKYKITNPYRRHLIPTQLQIHVEKILNQVSGSPYFLV